MESGYFEHGADVGVFGRGASLEEAFAGAAGATFRLMCATFPIAETERVAFAFEETDPELALVSYLNGLLAAAGDRGLALGRFSVKREGARWHAEAWGERWREGLERGTGVKGATLTMLSVRDEGGTWDARCVVDV